MQRVVDFFKGEVDIWENFAGRATSGGVEWQACRSSAEACRVIITELNDDPPKTVHAFKYLSDVARWTERRNQAAKAASLLEELQQQSGAQ